MMILKSGSRHRDLFPTTTSMAGVLPLAVSLPAVTVMFGDRLGTFATIAFIVLSLAAIACTAGLAARAAARDSASAEQARRDEAVLETLEPLAGLHR